MIANFGKFGRDPQNRALRRIAVACLAVAVVASVAACSSGSPSNSNSSAPAQGANVAAAKAAIAPFIGKPSEFPVAAPLSKSLAAGKSFAFLQCSSPVCAGVAVFFRQAVTAIGAKAIVINAGATAQTAQAAASSAVALKPDAVFISGNDPVLYGSGLKTLSAAGTKVISIQVNKDVKPYGITFNYLGSALSEQNGKLLADWVIANKGAKADAVLYTVPALDLSAHVQKVFTDELKKNCPSCKMRAVPIDVTTIGTTAANTVVTDLQAHPDTNVAVFVSYQVATGLPAALKAAGLSIITVGFAPTAGNLQDIKDGGLTAGLAIDFPVSIWTAVDAAARLVEGDQPTQGEKAGEIPEQFLGKNDITFDPTKGWSGYPDYTQRFAKLWLTS
jgi:ribose transport system substrate-binding protein